MRTDRPAMPLPPEIPPDMPRQVAAALQEDVGSGDVTAGLIPPSQAVTGEVVCRDAAVICGAPWVAETYRQLDPRVALEWRVAEGERVEPGRTVFRIEGPARPVLTGERTALNFLQLLSGTATAARRFADAVAGTGCTILDTRKTLPGLRTAQKYAVRCGGARNHRMGLYDMILVKENHIAAAGSLGAAVSAARRAGAGLPVEVEVESLAELEEALAAGPDIIMLDDFTLQDMRAAVERVRGGRRPQGRSPAGEAGRQPPVKLEASGSASLETVRGIAETGVDFVSVGALTKHVRAVDLSMRLVFTPPRT